MRYRETDVVVVSIKTGRQMVGKLRQTGRGTFFLPLSTIDALTTPKTFSLKKVREGM